VQFPIKKFSRIYHVGDMAVQPPPNSRSSHEGPCLSVSRTPNAWRHIAKLGMAPIWILSKPKGRFLDVCRISKEAWQIINAWAYQEGYAVECLAVMTECADMTENGDDIVKTYTHATREESVRELGEDDEEDIIRRYTEVTPAPTDKLVEYAEQHVNLGFAPDMLALAYAEHVLGLDGLYWHSELDMYCYAAPRAGIIRSKLSSWAITQAPAGFTTKEEEEI